MGAGRHRTLPPAIRLLPCLTLDDARDSVLAVSSMSAAVLHVLAVSFRHEPPHDAGVIRYVCALVLFRL
ncbi:uncharacterized protein TRAVEDRAFT_60148 [Trametes versicolor FP-101664 SS1]|uniref:uncharacterized protein n=1 Tax=Trametes versicolor (strain FP-101664) TaxID=717944 RepID=UPI00046220EF|nr:uncharacterized protein TRAVEDRAFT_60148 [Trametes versicolor FP-101664 SS1]EIW56169.1 hypothetical protein TRAVEDRAFT_60148 [Trametes versicolor FP-101664 SS1]